MTSSTQASPTLHTGDCLDWLRGLPDRSCSLCLTSPPYADARTYGMGFRLSGQDWVDWMIPRLVECCRVTHGLVLVNMAGPTHQGRYSPIVEWLVADLTRQHGLVCGPAPYCYFRFGIPGSGSKHYHRRDWEPIYALAHPRSIPLPWAENTAEGKPSRYGPGGGATARRRNGRREAAKEYHSPVIANPGNVIREYYDAEEVRQLLTSLLTHQMEPGNVIRCLAGGGHLGDKLAHDNEAPMSERLARFFIRSFAPPGGVVMDPFCGSGTTLAVAIQEKRRALGCDIRPSQIELTERRLKGIAPTLFPTDQGD